MAENTDNLTLKLLQEMRVEMRDMRTSMDGISAEMREMRSDLNTRMDGVTHIMTFLAGCNYQLDERVTKLEAK